MRLRTDDDIYRARLLYLGPPGYTLPVQLPYAQYGIFACFLAFYMFMYWVFAQGINLFPAWEIALSMVTTSLIFRYVDPDRPARAVLRTVITDWRNTREPNDEQREPRLVARDVRIREVVL